MKRFSVFAILYLVGFLMELQEEWEHLGLTMFFVIAAILIVSSRINLLKFTVFLSLTTLYFLIFHFPEVANHVNLLILANITIIFASIYGWIRYQKQFSSEFYFDLIRPILQIFVILVYTLAGFHKFNTDFLNPQVSCTGGMLYAINDMLKSRILYLPTAVIIFCGIFILLWQLKVLKKIASIISQFNWASNKLTGLIIVAVAITIAMGISLYKITGSIKLAIVLSNAVVVILWELVAGFLLIVPKLQASIILYSWTMHSVLALIGFVDFGALILAFLVTFIPDNYYQLLNANLNISQNIKIKRIYIYFAINIFIGILSLLHHYFIPINNYKTLVGIIFNIAALILIFPILKERFAIHQPMIWQGISIINTKFSKVLLIFPLLLFLYGMTSYFGLRTAGNFSMFSNLKTEGEVSNHLLLANNPLKIWSYQEDVVSFLEIDDEKFKIGHKYRPLKGNSLPVVEFKKLIYKWTKAGYEVPLTFKYQGQIYKTANIVNDPLWRTNRTDWQMFLFDFRVIQPDGLNQCRW